MKKPIAFLVGITLSTLLFSCKKDEDQTPKQTQAYEEGLFLVNEGDFNQGNGSIGYYNLRDTANVVYENDIFSKVNDRALGDIVQSLTFYNGKGYIAVNNSQKLEVVDANNFSSVATIQVGGPRYFTGINSTKGYLTDWSTNSVKVIDLNSHTITGSISTGVGPEKMVTDAQKVFVSNTGGFQFDPDSVLTVINTNTNTVEATIPVAPMPNSMQIDKNGKLWVICGGIFGYGTLPEMGGALVRVNKNQNIRELNLPMPSVTDHPQALAISPDGDFLYYALYDKVYKMSVNATTLPSAPFITLTESNPSIYGISVNPENGDVVVLNSPFTTRGKLLFYSASGQKMREFPSGKITNSVVFK